MASEWLKNNQSWLAVIALIGLLLIIFGGFWEFGQVYVSKEIFLHYNDNQDKTLRQHEVTMSDLDKQISTNEAGVAANKAKIEMLESWLLRCSGNEEN